MEASSNKKPARRWRSRLIALALMALVTMAIVWLGLRGADRAGDAGKGPSGGMRGSALPVAVQTVKREQMKVYFTALGTVTPLATATVHAQLSGQLMEVRFKEGDTVKAGAALALIDPRPYEAQLKQVQGALQRDRALLENARLDLARYQTLLTQDSVAQQTYDTQAALVKQYEGAVASDEGQVATAQLNLRYCNVVAPIGGRLGLRQVDPGNYVSPGDSAGLVVITQQTPISVLFSLPEDDIPALHEALAAGQGLEVQAFDRANARQLAQGRVTVLDNQIDTSTGTVKLRAQFENRDASLFPNQFVNVRVLARTLEQVPVLPVSAVQRGSQGSFVYLVKPDNTVAMRAVTLGPVDGERVAVSAGLEGGETVVSDGADQLKDGMSVSIAGAATPAPQKNGGDKPRRHRRPPPNGGP